MAKKLKVGDTVFCEKFGPMKHQFKGTISKIYENNLLVSIFQCQKVLIQL